MKRRGNVRAPSLASVTVNSADIFSSFQSFQAGSQNILNSLSMGSAQLAGTWVSFLQQILSFFTLITDNLLQTFTQSTTGISTSFGPGQAAGYGTGGNYFY